MLFKIDLEMTYDKVNWSFLRIALIDFGFPPVLIELIMNCLSASSLSLLWNGSCLHNFSLTRGLRQGDPISLHLFVLCIEKLALYIAE